MGHPPNVFDTVVEALEEKNFLFLDTRHPTYDHQHFDVVLNGMRDLYRSKMSLIDPTPTKAAPVYGFVANQNFKKIGHCEKAILVFIDHHYTNTVTGAGEIYYAVITWNSVIFFLYPTSGFGEFKKQLDHSKDIEIYSARIPPNFTKREISHLITRGLECVMAYKIGCVGVATAGRFI